MLRKRMGVLGVDRRNELAGKQHDGKHGDRMPSFPSVTDRFSDASNSSTEDEEEEEDYEDEGSMTEEGIPCAEESGPSGSAASSRAASPVSDAGSSRTIRPPAPAPLAGDGPPPAKAWYELDASIVLALLAPVVNWLTGGDHVQNALLLVLAVFYLHQLIESGPPIATLAFRLLTHFIFQSPGRSTTPPARGTPPTRKSPHAHKRSCTPSSGAPNSSTSSSLCSRPFLVHFSSAGSPRN
jgi:hypothetical protein